MTKKLFSLLLALLLVVGPLSASVLPAAAEDHPPLTVACDGITGQFDPFLFYTTTTSDEAVAALVGLRLLTTDRRGGIVYNAIEGETIPYHGTDYVYTGPADLSVHYDPDADRTDYTVSLRHDLKFWDGEPVTAKDVLFTYYTIMDPAYGNSDFLDYLSTGGVVGVNSWRIQVTDEIFEKYSRIASLLLEDGKENGYVPNDDYTEEMYDDFCGWIDEGWTDTVQGIIDYVNTEYAEDEYASRLGRETYAEIAGNEGLEVAYAMSLWGFGYLNEDGTFSDTAGLGTWDLVDTFPTVEDFVAVTKYSYGGDPIEFYRYESSGRDKGSIDDFARSSLIEKYGRIEMGDAEITSISGIRMLDDYTVRITVNGFYPTDVYTLLDVHVTPMHYYGDPAKWDPDNGLYGFERGNLEKFRSLIGVPRGAGPYVFESFEDGVVTFSANPNWYKGQPLTQTVLFKEIPDDTIPGALADGSVDIAEIIGNTSRFDQIANCNSNRQVTGDVITTLKTDYEGYGYVGINAANVNVGGEPGSDASKALRKALSTVLAVYRAEFFRDYYGEASALTEYPISRISWAAPDPTDPDYRTAFSTDASGKDIYTAGMSAEDRYAAAKAAALTWFEAAGYTVTDGKVTAAPEGAKLAFKVSIPSEDHPWYGTLVRAKESLEEIGIDLTIEISPGLLAYLDNDSLELWCLAFRFSTDPALEQMFQTGAPSNYFHISDEILDELLTQGSASCDQQICKPIYRQCLEIICDWAVVVPGYQRQNATLVSTQRVNLDTLTPDITTYWSWMNDIEKLEMGGKGPEFTDVPANAFYADSVRWAVANGVTNGTSDTTFGPKKDCTRGQVVTFLWRAMGSPQPTSSSHPFVDVKKSAYYYTAMLWAVENGITSGTDDTHFGPNKACTRGQVVTFLWRAMGSPQPASSSHPFEDVKKSAFYYTAMLWAVESGVTSGTSATLFSPNKVCNRGQVVTFLFRAVSE